MKKFTFYLILILFSSPVFSQPSIQWQKCLGGYYGASAYSLQQTSDGGYIVAGATASNDGDVSGNHSYGYTDIWVVKLTPAGSIQWQKCLGGTYDEEAYSIQQTNDGGYIVSGTTESNDGDVMGNHGGGFREVDIWIVKLNSTGNVQWQKCLGGTGFEVSYSIQQTADGGYIVAGNTTSNDGDVSGIHGNNGYLDIWVVKLNAAGTIQWQKCLGGSREETAYSIQQTNDGGFIVAGITYSNDGDVSGSHNQLFEDYWIIKLNASGNIQWQKCYGGTFSDIPGSIRQTYDGGFIIAGITDSNDGDINGNNSGTNRTFDLWIVKLNSTGNIIWHKCFGGTNTEDGSSIQKTADGGYIIAGSTSSNDGDVLGNHGSIDLWVVKLDSQGIIQWQKCLGGSSLDYIDGFIRWNIGENIIQQANDGGFIIGGSTQSNNGDVSGCYSSIGMWIVKLSPTIGIDELSSITSLDIYPNPTTDNLSIEFTLSKSEDITLQLKDVLGQNVLEPITMKNISGSQVQTISTTQLPNGIYFLELVGEGGRTTKKIVVQHR